MLPKNEKPSKYSDRFVLHVWLKFMSVADCQLVVTRRKITPVSIGIRAKLYENDDKY